MSAARCLHNPRIMVPNGARSKGGKPILYCHECKKAAQRKSRRKKQRYADWYERQQGLCAFCGLPLPDDNTTHLDHDHVTGRKRGLVHAACNTAIGGVEKALALVGEDRMRRYLDVNTT